ncbi:hypothetical protein LO762_17090 [Actinocorallia sp. API 0066]|uniref:hypothetical protein n=1 Tax=Actinocorallia sp. API 0066 TaxID=2896846 RepID=UPI001E2E8034|nr:hypothetical protein [Actinocorallia sp. API 0066]MCD0450897.1 hypothetical protein [Actinocorallia sp. API 0066]
MRDADRSAVPGDMGCPVRRARVEWAVLSLLRVPLAVLGVRARLRWEGRRPYLLVCRRGATVGTGVYPRRTSGNRFVLEVGEDGYVECPISNMRALLALIVWETSMPALVGRLRAAGGGR